MLTNVLGNGGLGGMAVGAFRRTALAMRDGCIAVAVTVAGSLLAVGDAPASAMEAIRAAAGLETGTPEVVLRQLLFATFVVGCLQSAMVVALVSLALRTAWAVGRRIAGIFTTGRPSIVAEAGHAG